MYEITKMPSSIDIGFTGEKLFREIQIDMTKWMEEMPEGVPSIVYIRPGDTPNDAYIPTTTFADNILTWNIEQDDLGGIEGSGVMQVWLEETENTTLVKRGKSAVVTVRVNGSITDPGDTDPPARTMLLNLEAEAEGLPAGSDPTAEWEHEGYYGDYTLKLGIPKGDKGDKGDQGDPAPAEQVTTAVDAYLAENFSNPSNPPLDRTLASSSSAAPADMVGSLKSAITNEIEQTQSDFKVLETDTVTLDVDFINRGVLNDGSLGDADSKRAATEHMIHVPYGCELEMTVPTGYRLNYWGFSTLDGAYTAREYSLVSKKLSGTACTFVRVLVTNDPNTTDISTATAKSVFTAKLYYVGKLLKTVNAEKIQTNARNQIFDIGTVVSWTIGGIAFTGEDQTSTARMRTNYIKASEGSVIRTQTTQYEFIVYEYSRNGKLITVRIASDWRTADYICSNPDTDTIRVVMRYKADPTTTMIGTEYTSMVIVPVSQKTPKLTDLATYRTIREAKWVIGGINFDNGGDNDNTQARLRCDLVEARKGTIIQLHDKTNYSYIVYEYMTNRAASISNIYTRSASDWRTDDYTVTSPDCAFIRICVKRADNNNFTGTAPGELFDIIANTDEEGSLITTAIFPASYYHTDSVQYDTTMTVSEIYAAYDALVSAFPNYIKKTDLGSDSSGSYHVYQLELTPETMYDGEDTTLANSMMAVYSKDGYTYRNINHPKIVMDAAMHGNEKPITRAMLNFVYNLCYNWLGNEVLEYLRWNVRFVIIPVVCPWGYDNTMRGNYNKVNINRNFNAGGLWENGSSVIPTDPSEISVSDYRGEYPLSEKEAQYVYNMLAGNKDANVYINWHTVGLFSSYSRMTAVAVPTYYGSTDTFEKIGIEQTKMITLNGWKYHDVPRNSGYIGKTGISPNVGTADNQAQYMGIPGVCMEGMYQIYNQPDTRDTHPVNCMNVEYITNAVLISLGHQLKNKQVIV